MKRFTGIVGAGQVESGSNRFAEIGEVIRDAGWGQWYPTHLAMKTAKWMGHGMSLENR
jgi:RimJ/RimL family protein N-acetyltransferase